MIWYYHVRWWCRPHIAANIKSSFFIFALNCGICRQLSFAFEEVYYTCNICKISWYVCTKKLTGASFQCTCLFRALYQTWQTSTRNWQFAQQVLRLVIASGMNANEDQPVTHTHSNSLRELGHGVAPCSHCTCVLRRVQDDNTLPFSQQGNLHLRWRASFKSTLKPISSCRNGFHPFSILPHTVFLMLCLLREIRLISRVDSLMNSLVCAWLCICVMAVEPFIQDPNATVIYIQISPVKDRFELFICCSWSC